MTLLATPRAGLTACVAKFAISAISTAALRKILFFIVFLKLKMSEYYTYHRLFLLLFYHF
jgi:hypothetical protein